MVTATRIVTAMAMAMATVTATATAMVMAMATATATGMATVTGTATMMVMVKNRTVSPSCSRTQITNMTPETQLDSGIHTSPAPSQHDTISSRQSAHRSASLMNGNRSWARRHLEFQQSCQRKPWQILVARRPLSKCGKSYNTTWVLGPDIWCFMHWSCMLGDAYVCSSWNCGERYCHWYQHGCPLHCD